MDLAKTFFPSLSEVRGRQAPALRHGLPHSSNFIHFIRATTSSPKSCCLQVDREASGRGRGTAGRSAAAAILSSRGRESRRPSRRERRGSGRPALFREQRGGSAARSVPSPSRAPGTRAAGSRPGPPAQRAPTGPAAAARGCRWRAR